MTQELKNVTVGQALQICLGHYDYAYDADGTFYREPGQVERIVSIRNRGRARIVSTDGGNEYKVTQLALDKGLVRLV